MSMFKKIAYFCGMLILTPALAIAATLKPMDSDEVTAALKDKTITTISAATLNGKVIPDKFTGYFSKDGKMTGKFGNKPADQPQDDTGTWKVKSDGRFCFEWEHWDSGKEKCVTLYKLNNGILVINEDNGFESFILESDIKSGNQLGN